MIRPMGIGVFIHSTGIEDPFDSIATIGEWGFRCTQLGVVPPDFYTDANAKRTLEAMKDTGVESVGFFVGFPGESYASMADVAATVGFAFPEKLAERMEIMRASIDFAAKCRQPGIHPRHHGVHHQPHQVAHAFVRQVALWPVEVGRAGRARRFGPGSCVH